MNVVFILGTLAAIAIPRITGGVVSTKDNTCTTNFDIVNSQIELYYSNNGTWPVQMSDVTGDPNYFPDGKPICPATGLVYLSNQVNSKVVSVFIEYIRTLRSFLIHVVH